MLQQDLVIYKNHSGVAGFEGTKGSWRAAEAWHCEEAIGEGAALVAVDGLGLKGSCKDVKLSTMRRA